MISHKTRLELESEGINTPKELVEFDEDSISEISNNLRRLGGRVPDLTHGAVTRATIPTPPFTSGSKSRGPIIKGAI